MRIHRAALAVLALGLAGCRTEVLHGLSEQDTNHAIAVLQEQGIAASKELDNPETNTWKVTVPRQDVVKVWSVLQQYRLPATPGRRFQDVFGKNKLVVAPIEEKALFLEALQGEIGHTLELVSGVVSARVHVAQPETDLSGQTSGEPRASVMIEFHPDASGQPPLQYEEVQKLVAHGIAALKPENVSVVMKPIQIVRSQQAYDFVAFGPIVVAAASVNALKLASVVIFAFFMFGGMLLWWQGRVMSELRYELIAAQRQVRATPRPPRSAA
jgi:type III secretion protein J